MSHQQPFNWSLFLKNVPHQPGVYQMLNAKAEIIYVGKAKDLHKRLQSYSKKNDLTAKTERLVGLISKIEIICTQSEVEALLLECNLIKKFKPRFNILLRDDKNFPYLFLSNDEYPKLRYFRGKAKEKGRYFGPYPNSDAVHNTLNMLQKLFQLRNCTNHFFQSRTRPCLQYQIKRCTAPCVSKITYEDYQVRVKQTLQFLEGKSKTLIGEFSDAMFKASKEKYFESAAWYRDQISHLRHVQQEQRISNQNKTGAIDVLACTLEENLACVYMLFIRNGAIVGSRAFFPKIPETNYNAAQILEAFLPQYYFRAERVSSLPDEIIVTPFISNHLALSATFHTEYQKKVRVKTTVRQITKKWVSMALENAAHALKAHHAKEIHFQGRWDALSALFPLQNIPEKLMCIDISHMQGEGTYASSVMFDKQGALTSEYRRFIIRDIQPGDDYAAIGQAVRRRFLQLLSEKKGWPDIAFIDGGKGQVNQADAVYQEFISEIKSEFIPPQLLIVGIAKGPERKPGLERLFLPHTRDPLSVKPDSPALLLIQQIRDEAHRFAISGHRSSQLRKRKRSLLEEIKGVGKKRRQDLLRYFGGWQGIKEASMDELARIKGVGNALAKKIYEALHPDCAE